MRKNNIRKETGVVSNSVSIPKLKVMVASTVHGFEDQLEQICSVLQGYGY